MPRYLSWLTLTTAYRVAVLVLLLLIFLRTGPTLEAAKAAEDAAEDAQGHAAAAEDNSEAAQNDAEAVADKLNAD